MHIIDSDTVYQALPMAVCVDVMADCMAAFQHEGQIAVPQRTFFDLPGGRNLFAAMPGAMTEPGVSGAKLLTICPDNPGRGIPAIQGVIMLFDGDTGSPVAVVDAGAITAIRTAAASGAATRALAREDAKTLGILGFGVQANSHLEAMLTVRPVEQVYVWGPSFELASQFAERQAEKYEASIEAVETAKEAVENADIVCTVTSSPDPLIEGEWIRPGTHLNLVGAFSPTTREVDTETIRRARLIVEVLEFALAEAGEIIIPLNEGAITEDHIAGEIGQVILGDVRGRTSESDITVYKSLGNTAQDLSAAEAAYRRALGSGLGAEAAF